MAKTQAPLFSISAAGTVGRIVTFRRTTNGGIAQVRPMSAPAPTAARLAIRDIGRTTRETWRALDNDERAAWTAYAATRSLPPYAAYLQECMRQRPAPGDQPQLPAT